MNPNYVDAYFAQGCAWLELDKYEKSIADFTGVICLDPLHAAAYFNRGKGEGVTCRDMKMLLPTLIQLSILKKNNASLASYYYTRSLAKNLLGRVDEEKGDLRTALKLATQVGNKDIKTLAETNLRNLN